MVSNNSRDFSYLLHLSLMLIVFIGLGVTARTWKNKFPSDANAKTVGTSTPETERRSQRPIRSERTESFRSPESNENRVPVHSDGSVTFPAELLSSISSYPLRSQDNTLRHEELIKYGFSEAQCVEVEHLIEKVKTDLFLNEEGNYRIITQGDDQVLIDIPGNVERAAVIKKEIQDSLKKVGDDKGELLTALMSDSLGNLTANFGSRRRIVNLEKNAENIFKFEVLEVSSESVAKINLDTTPVSKIREFAFSRQEFTADSVPERLKHLFSEL